MEAIEAGVHVVADKPFAPNAQAARTAAGIIASAQGNYAGFYTWFARAVRGAGPGPVPAAGGIRTLEVLDAARRSAVKNAVIALW